MSWRCVVKLFVRHGPVQFAPPSYEKIESGLRAGDDVVAVVRIDAHLADGLVLRELARRLREGGAEDVGAEHGPVAPASVDFRMPWLPMEKEP